MTEKVIKLLFYRVCPLGQTYRSRREYRVLCTYRVRRTYRITAGVHIVGNAFMHSETQHQHFSSFQPVNFRNG